MYNTEHIKVKININKPTKKDSYNHAYRIMQVGSHAQRSVSVIYVRA